MGVVHKGDKVIFVNEDITDIRKINIYEIENISKDNLTYSFINAGFLINIEKLDDLLSEIRKEEDENI